MILLDSDVLIVDARYLRDSRFAINQQALQQLLSGGVPLGITVQALLEVVGVQSFNTPRSQIPGLPQRLMNQYQLHLWPDPSQVPDYAGCTFDGLVAQMSQQMSLGDAVQALQLLRFVNHAQCLIT